MSKIPFKYPIFLLLVIWIQQLFLKNMYVYIKCIKCYPQIYYYGTFHNVTFPESPSVSTHVRTVDIVRYLRGRPSWIEGRTIVSLKLTT